MLKKEAKPAEKPRTTPSKPLLLDLKNVSVNNFFFFFSSRRRHTRSLRDWSSDVCSSDLVCGDSLDELETRLADHRELDARIGAREPRHDLRQITVGVVVGYAQPHPPGEREIRECGERFDVELHDPPRVIEQPLAVLGQLRGAPVPGENRPLQPFLEPFIC